ncbi:DUF2971 domain-containing protein [Bradyrhizobium hipponense]|uniref:DUF2971 domain-containing protein n=1 Tax=Bradyrhizobium hipponense TaxID=2605638 RepID=A0A5S4YDQ1_9BRAD|nr:DUF2971 domain-containing protein [Bradyrhizobium hipponense]
MWTHYAGRSSGICVEYRPLKLVASLPRETRLVRVAYDDKPAFVSVADMDNIPSAIRKVLSQKKFNWAYEREWRLAELSWRNESQRKDRDKAHLSRHSHHG